MSPTLDLEALVRSIKAQWPQSPVQLIETHISWVVVTDTVAFKIKKPVKYAFVDFRTLALRKHFCEEELRLNQRLAPDLYQAVVPICRELATGQWHIDPNPAPKSCEVLEWAVKMRAFNAHATLDKASEILPAQVDAIADAIAAFHQHEAPIAPTSKLGSPTEISRLAIENLRELHTLLPHEARLELLSSWTQEMLARLSSFFEQRQRAGYVKECHGDLHLGNIAWGNNHPIIFDCIEFSDTLRCIDVINEIAFLFMDFHAHAKPELAWRFLNRWLEHTADYAGLEGLMFYACYRALVRAKISAHQGKPKEAKHYVSLAQAFTELKRPSLSLMHGFSGSGKTYASQLLLQKQGSIRIRSDVERKRLSGFAQDSSSESNLGKGLYSQVATTQTFDRLFELTHTLLQLGFKVIVDATFLKQDLRARFIALGRKLAVPIKIIDMAVTPQQCRERIIQRKAAGSDASEATLEVLEHQLCTADPFTPEELALVQVSGTMPDTAPENH